MRNRGQTTPQKRALGMPNRGGQGYDRSDSELPVQGFSFVASCAGSAHLMAPIL